MKRGTRQSLVLCGVATIGATVVGFSSWTPARALPGDLPNPLAQMTGGELWTFGNGLRWDNGPVQPRDCQQGACNGRIDAVRDQTPGPAEIGANGTVVARLQNLGSGGANRGRENRYGTERGNNTRTFIVALPDGSGGWTWTVAVARRGDNDPVQLASSGNWVTCAHDPANPGHPKGRSQFVSCSTGAGGAGGDDDAPRMSGPSHEHSAPGVMRNPFDPGWLSCSAGCCTAGE